MVLNINNIKFNTIFITFLSITLCVLVNNCNDSKSDLTTEINHKSLIIGVSADYPPFEFIQRGEFKGFDIELAKLIAKDLNKEIKFKDLTYNNLFLALNSGQIDMAISTITFTKERSKYFDLSIPYYFTDLAVIFRQDHPIKNISDLYFKKIGVQLGSTMEIWAKDLINVDLVRMDLNLQLIEALKSKQLDAVVIEYIQAREFCKNNPELRSMIISKSENGYVIALKKGSKLLPKVNAALNNINQREELKHLKNKWLEISFEMEIHDAS